MRRRSVDMISGEVFEPEKEGPPRSVSARRSASSNSAAPSYADSEPPSWKDTDDGYVDDAPIRKVKGVLLPHSQSAALAPGRVVEHGCICMQYAAAPAEDLRLW